jgi:F0F1-type ATP synthase membrane subunit c/vacuolar-type H+-ATPase subunit K
MSATKAIWFALIAGQGLVFTGKGKGSKFSTARNATIRFRQLKGQFLKKLILKYGNGLK